jgi:hypothetical protein
MGGIAVYWTSIKGTAYSLETHMAATVELDSSTEQTRSTSHEITLINGVSVEIYTWKGTSLSRVVPFTSKGVTIVRHVFPSFNGSTHSIPKKRTPCLTHLRYFIKSLSKIDHASPFPTPPSIPCKIASSREAQLHLECDHEKEQFPCIEAQASLDGKESIDEEYSIRVEKYPSE